MEILFRYPVLTLAAAFATAFLFAFFSFPAINQIAKARLIYGFTKNGDAGLVMRHTPALGGVAFFTGFFVAAAYFIPSVAAHYLLHILAATIILFMAGMKADMLAIQPFSRLLAVIAAMVLCLEGFGRTPDDLVLLVRSLPKVPIQPLLYRLPLLVLIIYLFLTFYRVERLALLMILVIGTGLLFWFGPVFDKTHTVITMAFLGALLPMIIQELFRQKKVLPGQSGILMTSFLTGFLLLQLSRSYSHKAYFYGAAVNPVIPVLGFLILLALVLHLGVLKPSAQRPAVPGGGNTAAFPTGGLTAILLCLALTVFISFFMNSFLTLILLALTWILFVIYMWKGVLPKAAAPGS